MSFGLVPLRPARSARNEVRLLIRRMWRPVSSSRIVRAPESRTITSSTGICAGPGSWKGAIVSWSILVRATFSSSSWM